MDGNTFDEKVADAKTRIREVTPVEVMEMRRRGEEMVVLDVREPNEWNLFRIPGAVHMPLGNVREKVGEAVSPQRPVVVYCARGGRAAVAADTMRELGYTQVMSIAGGVMAWMNAGGELEE